MRQKRLTQEAQTGFDSRSIETAVLSLVFSASNFHIEYAVKLYIIMLHYLHCCH